MEKPEAGILLMGLRLLKFVVFSAWVFDTESTVLIRKVIFIEVIGFNYH